MWHCYNTVTRLTTKLQYGLPGDIPALRPPRLPHTAAHDVDGDGRSGVMVCRPATGMWYTRLSSGDFTTTTSWPWGLINDISVTGDYDGDGLSDLAVYRPASGEWYVRYSSTDYATSWWCQWGLEGDQPADRAALPAEERTR